MVARSFGSADRGISRVHELARQPAGRQSPVQRSLRPRLVALALHTDEVVQVAGGWLCDQALAGWDVTVVTADHADQRALRILGVRGSHLQSALERPVHGACLHGICVQAELYEVDERVRRMVHNTVEVGRTEIRVWGDGCADDLEVRADLVSHRLSGAARAFKAQAVGDAAAWPADTEQFRRAATGRLALV